MIHFQVNTSSSCGNLTPLHLAKKNGFNNLAEVFQNHGADLSLPGLVAAGALGLIQTMLSDRSVDVLEKDQKGEHALGLAAKNGHPKVAETLLRAGADVFQANKRGQLALHVAMSEEVAEALLDGPTQGGKLLPSFPPKIHKHNFTNRPGQDDYG